MNSFRPTISGEVGADDNSDPSAVQTGNRPMTESLESTLSSEVLNRRLHDQQFYTRSLIESNIDSLMTTDTRGVITDVNQQMVDLTGRTRDELIGAPCRNFFTNPTRADTAIARVMKEDRIIDYELTVRSFDGTETVVSYNAATLRNRERTVQGVFAAARDVTESKRFERALMEKNAKLEQASIARAEYLKRAEAELLPPLRAVVAASESLKSGRDGKLSPMQLQHSAEIHADSQHLLSLLIELIDMSTVETGRVDFNYQNVDVRALLKTCTAAAEQADHLHGTVQIDVASDLGTFPLDARNTEQIIGVLLSNAVIASSGGDVTIQARIVDRRDVGQFDGRRPSWCFPLAVSAFTDFLEVRVSDRGVGICAQDLPAVFLPLRRGEAGATWKSDGNGVGLAVVKLFVELQGGTLGVDGARGDGATFAIWLPRRGLPATSGVNGSQAIPAQLSSPDETYSMEPLAENGDVLQQPAAQPLIAAANADANVDLQGLGVAVVGIASSSGHSSALVVEDDLKSAKLVRLLLEAEGFRVFTAPSAEEALEIAQRVPLNLITLDVQLPGMDGWKFLLKLHDSAELASIPVVVIAGLADMSMALSRGAAAVLEKPLTRSELQNSLSLLGLRPDRSHTRCVLVVDDDHDTVDQVRSFLDQPAYRIETAATGTAAISAAVTLTPDLIMINLMMDELRGFKIVRALQSNEATQHIPVLVMSSLKISDEEQDTIDFDPNQPVVAMNKPDFNREALLAGIMRALG